MKLKILLAFLAGIATAIAVVAALYRSADSDVAKAKAELDVYYPGTEKLAPDEMRVVALGTGMPSPRPKQAPACWLVAPGKGATSPFSTGPGSPAEASPRQTEILPEMGEAIQKVIRCRVVSMAS